MAHQFIIKGIEVYKKEVDHFKLREENNIYKEKRINKGFRIHNI